MSKPIPGGFLVAVEGIDGAGKTTQVEFLESHLREAGIAHIVSKEPTRGKFGRLLRESASSGRLSLEEELALFVKDRREHVEKLIAPSLAEERVVILDRYYFSNAAYQGARGADPCAVLAENEKFAPKPDLMILLDIPPSIGLARVRGRGDEPNSFEEESSLNVARNILLAIEKPFVVKIDARQGLESVSYQVMQTFRQAAMRKISSQHLSPEGLQRTLELLGAPRLECV